MNADYIEKSKYLSYILRHRPDALGLKLTKDGWLDIAQFIEACQKKNISFSQEDIRYIVENNNKNRFAYSDDGLRIRASQGHSVKNVKIPMASKIPPPVLYHGTTTRFLNSILKKGLLPKTRHHVHLSKDIKTALSVGGRHGDPELLQINAADMYASGNHTFYLSENNVWLTDTVPVKYLTHIRIENEPDTSVSI